VSDELKTYEAELADIRKRRDAVQRRIDQATADSTAAKVKSARDNASARITAAQKEQTDLDTAATRISERISALNDASSGRIQAGRAAGETAKRTLLDDAPRPFTEFYENIRKDVPLPPASFLPAAVTAALFGAAKLPTIPSNWMGRAKASGLMRDAGKTTDVAQKSAAMNRVDELVNQHGFLYRPTLKDGGMMGAAFGTGALAGVAPTAYDMMLPDVNQNKKAELANVAALADEDPRKAELQEQANKMGDDNPARTAAFKRLNDPYFYLKQMGLAGLEGVAGYEAADLLSKGLKFPFRNPKAEVAAFKRNTSVDNAAGIYEGKLAEAMANRAPTSRDVSQALKQTRGQPVNLPVQPPNPNPAGNVPPIPPGQLPQLPPPPGGSSYNRKGALPFSVSEQKSMEQQLTALMANGKLPALAGLPVAGAAMMGGGQDAAAQGMNPMVMMAFEELRRRGLLAEPDSAPGLFGAR